LRNIDVTLRVVRPARIEGMVVANENLAGSLDVFLTNATRWPDATRTLPTVRITGDGHFLVDGVLPGSYVITARTRRIPVGANGLSTGLVTVDVGSGDVSGVVVNLRSGATIRGTVRVDGESPSPMQNCRIAMVPVSGKAQPGTLPVAAPLSKLGTFVTSGLSPGWYAPDIQSCTSSPGDAPALRSAQVENRDVADSGFEVKGDEEIQLAIDLTNRFASIQGTLEDAEGRPTSNYSIVLFAKNENAWGPRSSRILIAKAGTDGSFSFPRVVPGEYWLAAGTGLTGQSADPDFLRSIAGTSVSVTASAGTKVVQRLRVSK
jgi:hypothetical protein